MSPDTYRFDVALSFAGADREVARVIASIAAENGLRVFFDEEQQWESWGKNLNEYLGSIYDRESRYCVILISRDYTEKNYTNHERRIALDRALESKSEFILPVRLDDSWLDGLPRATAYLDLRKMTSIDVGRLLVQKIKGPGTAVSVPEGIKSPKLERVDSAANDQPFSSTRQNNQLLEFVDIHPTKDSLWGTYEPTGEATDMAFREIGGTYHDPIFDVTIMSRHDKPILLTAVGVEFVRLGLGEIMLLGGGAITVPQDRTYKLSLPDLWQTLGLKQRELNLARTEAVTVSEPAYCRLPDPILIDSYGVYRFGFHLLDFVMHCPNDVEMFFCARTDKGTMRSGRFQLSYLIGGDIPPLTRYSRIREADSEPAKYQEETARLMLERARARPL